MAMVLGVSLLLSSLLHPQKGSEPLADRHAAKRAPADIEGHSEAAEFSRPG
jgi:hypothetical protein